MFIHGPTAEKVKKSRDLIEAKREEEVSALEQRQKERDVMMATTALKGIVINNPKPTNCFSPSSLGASPEREREAKAWRKERKKNPIPPAFVFTRCEGEGRYGSDAK